MTNTFPPETTERPTSSVFTIYIHALAVLCFNQTDDRAEIGFLDLPEHETYITMTTSSKREVIPRTRLSGLLNIGSASGLGRCLRGGDEDFGQICDLSKIYDQRVGLKDDSGSYSSKVHMHNCVFAADPSSIFSAELYDVNDPTSVVRSMRVARVLKVYTSSDAVFEFLGVRYPFEGEDYEIVIDGECPRSSEGDFHHYFDVLDGAGDVRYNLRFLEGNYPWMSPGQNGELSGLVELLANFRDVSEKGSLLNHRPQIQHSLELLLRAFRCSPAPCQLATITNAPTRLP